ncbi:MAG: hemerythrin family protein [Magnetococcales bacterium]|nr:hemerythrin family protein [Magnetococcales bacterium]MBF0150269.1 hemerythrin family protein [Magnetococcales bacterium]MBF0172149.1 hemerythrin family protein [Magnetococcales bacterium]MBF0347949.1 hemerythrin family protein [Magnetococcales bacterium]MBF0630551.1 hemerythrin family protein [Magnetococcales bacterium]
MRLDPAAQSARLVWDKDLFIGIQMVDQDHQQIVVLINQVLDAMETGRTSEKFLSSLLDELIQFAKEHFRREEDLMDQYGYPELQSHREVHRFLENKIMNHKKAFLAGEAELGIAADLMKDWIVLHIQGVDRKYSRFLQARGVA